MFEITKDAYWRKASKWEHCCKCNQQCIYTPFAIQQGHSELWKAQRKKALEIAKEIDNVDWKSWCCFISVSPLGNMIRLFRNCKRDWRCRLEILVLLHISQSLGQYEKAIQNNYEKQALDVAEETRKRHQAGVLVCIGNICRTCHVVIVTSITRLLRTVKRYL